MARASPPRRSAAGSPTSAHAVEAYVRARRADYGIVEEYGGHGIGTEMHQDPHVLNYGRPGRGPELVQGLALAVEPMVTLGSPRHPRARRRLDRRHRRRQPGPRTSSTRSPSPRTGRWVLTALDGGAARLAELGVTAAGRLRCT